MEDAGEFKLSLCRADAIEVQVRKPHAARKYSAVVMGLIVVSS